MQQNSERKEKLAALTRLEEEERTHRTRLETPQTHSRPALPQSHRLLALLPRELNEMVLSHLGSRSLQRLKRVSKLWHEVLSFVLTKRCRLCWGPWSCIGSQETTIVQLNANGSFTAEQTYSRNVQYVGVSQRSSYFGTNTGKLSVSGRWLLLARPLDPEDEIVLCGAGVEEAARHRDFTHAQLREKTSVAQWRFSIPLHLMQPLTGTWRRGIAC